MIVECPGCTTVFPVDPKKVPEGGIHARCTVCSDVFFVNVPESVPEETDAMASSQVTEAEMPRTEDAFGEPIVKLDEGPPPLEEPTEVEEGWPADEEEREEPPSLEEPTEVESGWPADEEEREEPPSLEEPTEVETGWPAAEEGFEEPESTASDAEVLFDEPEQHPEVTEGPGIATPTFGKRDPKEKAQRLARVLVSDIILYNPDRHHSATEAGRVKEEFEEEIQKSWTEYVEQVGEDVANNTPYFTDALNEILAKGDQVF